MRCHLRVAQISKTAIVEGDSGLGWAASRGARARRSSVAFRVWRSARCVPRPKCAPQVLLCRLTIAPGGLGHAGPIRKGHSRKLPLR